MTEAFLDIKRWGNSLGIQLPASIKVGKWSSHRLPMSCLHLSNGWHVSTRHDMVAK